LNKKGGHMARYSLFIIAAVIIGLFTHPAVYARQETQPLQVNDYKIGPKDLLEITVFGLPELTQMVRVASILDKQYTKEARVTVFIREYQKVSVIGAVGRPGQYELVGPTTLLQVIAQAGGLTAQAMNELYIYRLGEDGQQTRIAILVEELMSKGDQSLNIELQPKDVISIPIDQMQNVFVYGEVNAPGAISYLASKKITLLQAIAQAGSTTEWAKKSKLMIKRKDKKNGKEMTIRVNLKNLINGKVADIVLEEGDVVIVR
jgi:polysaccharide export outer membrane protein